MTSISHPDADSTPSQLTSRQRWPWILAAVCLAVGYGPLLWVHFKQLWLRPEYQYFPFVLAAFAGLLYVRGRESSPVDRQRPAWPVLPVAAASMLFLVAASVLFSPWLAAVSAILMVAAAFLFISGHRQVHNLWGIWILLWLVIPLPMNMDVRLVQLLQRVSSKVSSQALDLLGVDHAMAGNVLELPNKSFFVDEACSGIVSVMSVLAAGAIFAVWKNRSPVHFVLLLVAGAVWATVMNVGRICITAIVFARWDVDWSTGAAHEILGLSLFMLTFVALVATDFLLRFMLEPIPAAQTDTSQVARNPLVSIFNVVSNMGTPRKAAGMASVSVPLHLPRALLATSLLAAFLGIQTVIFAGSGVSKQEVSYEWVDRAKQVSEFASEQIAGWQIQETRAEERERDSIFGHYSRIFTVGNEALNAPVTLSVDFPFRGCHELTVCYESIGWELSMRTTESAPVATGGEWGYVRAEFRQPMGQHGLLYFSHCDSRGIPLTPEPPDANGLIDRFVGRLTAGFRPPAARPGALQTQAWVVTDQAPDPKLDACVRELFLAFTSQVRGYMAATGETGLGSMVDPIVKTTELRK